MTVPTIDTFPPVRPVPTWWRIASRLRRPTLPQARRAPDPAALLAARARRAETRAAVDRLLR